MTYLAIAKLAADGLLFGALIFLAFRIVKKQPGSNANFLKLKELEVSLKEIVRQADDASQTLNNELLIRKRELEKILADAQMHESRLAQVESNLSASIREAEFRNQELQKKNTSSVRTTSQPSANNLHSRVQQGREKIAAPNTNSAHFDYAMMLEPPSFSQIASATEKSISQTAAIPPTSPLGRKIEKYNDNRQLNELKNPLAQIASAAQRSIEASKIPDHLEQALSEREKIDLNTDPRLGVLGGLRRNTQVV